MEYRIEVKAWMLKKSSDGFDFMQKFNNDIPMPLMVMYTSGKLEETRGMVKMTLHGDIKERVTMTCMCCGRPITNKISQFFGIGPICGDHNYVNPFETQEELDAAVAAYREKLVNTIWTGWIAKSAIKSIQDERGAELYIDELPTLESPVSKKTETAPKAASATIVKARIDKPIRCTDDYSVFLSFGYNKDIVAAVKSLRSRFWNPDTKEWEIGYNELVELQSVLSNIDFEIINSEILPKVDKIGVDKVEFKTTPYAYQLEGVEFGLDHNRYLLADEQGLGKTKQVIDIAVARKRELGFKHCLIICGVNSLKWNWLEEIKVHSNESGWILGMYPSKKSGKWMVGGNQEKLNDLRDLGEDYDLDSHYFIITNIESLRNPEIAAKIKELCDKEIINMVAIDEIHRCKNLNTKQGEGMLQVQPTYRIGMTGTPLLNTPLDLYAILKWLGYESYSYYSFKNYFCYTDAYGSVIGYKNIDQLKAQLAPIMIRRLKKEVLDLPEKIRVNEYVDLSDEQKTMYNKVIDQMIQDTDIGEKISLDNQLALKIRLRQVSGGIGPFNFFKKNPKLDRLEQIVEEAVYSGTKVIVYSNWVQGITPAVERLQKYNPVVITGETKDEDRQILKQKFQEDPSVKVILGTIGALGTGHTLTAATEVVFLDEPWTYGAKEQAEDRAHRIGTQSSVTIHTIIAHGTYDEDVHAIVESKKELSEDIVDQEKFATKAALSKLYIA